MRVPRIVRSQQTGQPVLLERSKPAVKPVYQIFVAMAKRQPELKLLCVLLVAVFCSGALAQFEYDGYDNYGYDFDDMGAGGEQLQQAN